MLRIWSSAQAQGHLSPNVESEKKSSEMASGMYPQWEPSKQPFSQPASLDKFKCQFVLFSNSGLQSKLLKLETSGVHRVVIGAGALVKHVGRVVWVG